MENSNKKVYHSLCNATIDLNTVMAVQWLSIYNPTRVNGHVTDGIREKYKGVKEGVLVIFNNGIDIFEECGKDVYYQLTEVLIGLD